MPDGDTETGNTGDVGRDDDAGDTGTDAGDSECEANQEYCGGECRSCPEHGVSQVECDGGQCVASDCESGYVVCQLGCCPVESVLVDDAGDGGGDLDIKVDSEGMPHIIYDRSSQLPRHVQYAWYDGAEWQNAIVDGGEPDDGNMGAHLSMAVDSQDRVHAAYRSYPSSYSVGRYAVQNGDGWETEQISSQGAGQYIAIAIDDDDTPWVVHASYLDNEWYLTHSDGDGWIDDPVETTSQIEGYNLDITMDSQGLPHVAGVTSGAPGPGVYLSKEEQGGDWNLLTTVDDPEGDPRIALDADEEPVIALHDETSGHVPRLARWSDIEWDIEPIEDCGTCGWNIAMALDSQDRPHVAYRRYTESDALIYAHDDGSEWTHTVVAEGFFPESIALDVDDEDRAHIAYRGEDPSHVRYVVVEP